MLENTVIIIVVVIFSGVVENSTVEDEDLRPTNVVSLLLYALFNCMDYDLIDRNPRKLN